MWDISLVWVWALPRNVPQFFVEGAFRNASISSGALWVDSERKAGAPGKKREGDKLGKIPVTLSNHMFLLKGSPPGAPTITSRNYRAEMMALNAGAFRGFRRGHCPETPHRF